MSDSPPAAHLVTVVIVNFKVADYALQALQSLREAELANSTEVIIVDNASRDKSREVIMRDFPSVRWIELKSNIGFGKACNVGAQHASGDYILFLNPDTVLSHNTLKECLNFLETHHEAGIVGPKIIDAKGQLQASSHRSFPTPFNTFCQLFGLSRLFPKSRLFGRYNLTYLDPDVACEVDAISGSFMFLRTSVFKEIGGFDESFFMYGEDLDLCARVREKGFQVWYLPGTQIVHFKGKSSAKQAFRSRLAFYDAMLLFSRKYWHSYGSFLPRGLIYIGILLQAGMNIGGVLLRSATACLIDLLIVNSLLWAAITVRFTQASMVSPYAEGELLSMAVMHGIISMSFLLTYAVQGIYSTARYTPSHALAAGLIASTVFVASIYFTKAMAFSRIAFAFSAFASSFLLVGWRELLPRLKTGYKRMIFSTGRVIIVGNGDVARRLIRNSEEDRTAHIAGIVWPLNESFPGEFEGYPVLGTISNIKYILGAQRIEYLLIATTESWYSYFIEALGSLRLRHLSVKWVRRELCDIPAENLPAVIPLQDFSV